MIKAVIDTNVVVSALLSEDGPEAAILERVVLGEIMWCVSAPILAEYRTTLMRAKFAHVDRRKINTVLAAAQSGKATTVTMTLTHSRHEPDNRFYECAHASAADYIVTGNRKHFEKDLPPTRIVNARELLAILKT